jgi:4-amino-4-deoxy-L-arabinose transferase-like glycosyltransferase
MGGLAALVFLIGLGRRDIAVSHEARVAESAREMVAVGWPWSGQRTLIQPSRVVHLGPIIRLEPDQNAPPMAVNPWIVPLLNGEARLQKPPLPYWCAAVLFQLFGFSEWAARVTPALMGALGTLLMYDLARLLAGRGRARLAALVWITTFFIPDDYRKAMPDPYLAFMTMACVWAWVKACFNQGNTRGLILLFYVFIALGLLAKGPVILLHVVTALALFHFCYRKRWSGVAWPHLAGFIVVLLIALPWCIAVLHSVPNAIEIWRYESVGEITDNTENARPFWFYLPNLVLISVPWTAATVVGLIVAVRRRRIDLRRLFPIFWFGATVVFFSFVHLKKNPYLLPTMPALTLVIADGLYAALAAARRGGRWAWGGIILVVQTAIGIGFCVLLIVLIFTQTAHRPACVGLASAALLLAFVPLVVMRFGIRRWLCWQTAAYVVLTIGFFLAYETPFDNARSPKALAAELVQKAEEPDTTILRQHLPEEVAVYLPLKRESETAQFVLVVIDDQKGVKDRQKSRQTPDVPSPDSFAGWFPNAQVLFVDRVPMRSAPGDARWKVYELTLQRQVYAAPLRASPAPTASLVRSRSTATS